MKKQENQITEDGGNSQYSPLTSDDLLSLRGCNRCRLKGMCRQIREASQEHFRWSVHNLVAHPLSEMAWLIGMKRLSHWLHDKSIPVHEPENGRE